MVLKQWNHSLSLKNCCCLGLTTRDSVVMSPGCVAQVETFCKWTCKKWLEHRRGEDYFDQGAMGCEGFELRFEG